MRSTLQRLAVCCSNKPAILDMYCMHRTYMHGQLCICVYVYACVCVCVCVCLCMCAYAPVALVVSSCAFSLYICMYIHVRVVCARVCACVHVRVFVCACMCLCCWECSRVRMCTCVYMCLCVCVYACTWNFRVCIFLCVGTQRLPGHQCLCRAQRSEIHEPHHELQTVLRHRHYAVYLRAAFSTERSFLLIFLCPTRTLMHGMHKIQKLRLYISCDAC